MPSDVGIVLGKVKETILADNCVDSGESGGGAWGHFVNLNQLQPTCPLKMIPGPTAMTATLPGTTLQYTKVTENIYICPYFVFITKQNVLFSSEYFA